MSAAYGSTGRFASVKAIALIAAWLVLGPIIFMAVSIAYWHDYFVLMRALRRDK